MPDSAKYCSAFLFHTYKEKRNIHILLSWIIFSLTYYNKFHQTFYGWIAPHSRCFTRSDIKIQKKRSLQRQIITKMLPFPKLFNGWLGLVPPIEPTSTTCLTPAVFAETKVERPCNFLTKTSILKCHTTHHTQGPGQTIKLSIVTANFLNVFLTS